MLCTTVLNELSVSLNVMQIERRRGIRYSDDQL